MRTDALLESYDQYPTAKPQQPMPAFAARVDKIRERMIPLHERLAPKLALIPPDVAAGGVKLETIWPMCIGQQRSKPTAAAVAAALRELGWQRRRFYSDTGPSLALWFPPVRKG